MYVCSALEIIGLKGLHMRKENRILRFAIKCTKYITNKDMFPLNQSTDTPDVINREKLHVNKVYTKTIETQQFHISKGSSMNILNPPPLFNSPSSLFHPPHQIKKVINIRVNDYIYKLNCF